MKKASEWLSKAGSIIQDTWNFLDGKKTAIGTGLLLISKIFPQHTAVYQICNGLGELLGGVGLLDKGRKSLKK